MSSPPLDEKAMKEFQAYQKQKAQQEGEEVQMDQEAAVAPPPPGGFEPATNYNGYAGNQTWGKPQQTWSQPQPQFDWSNFHGLNVRKMGWGKNVLLYRLCAPCQKRMAYSKEKLSLAGDYLVLKIEFCPNCVQRNCYAHDVLGRVQPEKNE